MHPYISLKTCPNYSIPGIFVQTNQRLTQNSISEMSDMKCFVSICTNKFNNDRTFFFLMSYCMFRKIKYDSCKFPIIQEKINIGAKCLCSFNKRILGFCVEFLCKQFCCFGRIDFLFFCILKNRKRDISHLWFWRVSKCN